MENKRQEYTKEEQEKFEQAYEILSDLLSGEERAGFIIIQASKSRGLYVGRQGDSFTLAAAIYSIMISNDERNSAVKEIIKSGYVMAGNDVPDLTAIMKRCNNVLRELNDTMTSALKKKGGREK